MNLENELYELLETAQSHMPPEMHKAYEQAVDKAMRQHSHRGYGWWHHDWDEEAVVHVPFFALAIGFLGGVALMWLFDPERGERRRAMLRGEATKVAHEAEHEAGRVRSEANKLVHEAEHEAAHLRGQAGQADDAAARQARSTAADVKNTAANTAADVKNRVENDLPPKPSNPSQ